MPIALERVTTHGRGLRRPECVLAHRSGLLFASDWTGHGGVSVIRPDGSVERILCRDIALRPNGIALEPGGSFLLAHLGDERGGVFRLYPDGAVETVIDSLDGEPLPPTNFVVADRRGRLWITVSTRLRPRAAAYRGDVADGFVLLKDDNGARIVADGLGYTNECLVSTDLGTLYVNETFARRTSRYALDADGAAGERVTCAEYADGVFPDGLCLDSGGGLWITSIISNRVIRVEPEGGKTLLLEDCDADHIAAVETAFAVHALGRPHLDRVVSRRLRNISSLAFGGPDLRSGYLGCLLGESIYRIDMPVAGAPPAHWSADLGPLQRYC